jgi:hypothetical protein
MKAIEFKKFIKAAVKEAIQEELKEILLESIKGSKKQISENYINAPKPEPESEITYMDKRKAYMDILGGMDASLKGDTMSFNSGTFRPTAVNTAAEGSALPPGELDLSQIASLLNK